MRQRGISLLYAEVENTRERARAISVPPIAPSIV